MTSAAAAAPPANPALIAATCPAIPCDEDSLRWCERALELMLTQRGDAFAEVERLLADDPSCLVGHCLRAALVVRAESAAGRPLLAASVAAIEAACPASDNPARRHAAAAQAWLDGSPAAAASLYDAIVADWPRDVLALAVAQALDFHLGRRRRMRDRIARVLRHWSDGTSGHASLLAMHAFALEENEQYRRAEEIARRALALDPGHPGAIHAVAHVMEMQGRAHDGLDFLAGTEAAWGNGTALSAHLAWHRALFHLDADQPAAALAIYDTRIATADPSDLSALADGSALLWRLQLQKVDVGERWRPLAGRWATHDLEEARAFYVAHAMMAFAGAGRIADVGRVAEALAGAGVNRGLGAGAPPIPQDALVSPLREALLAFVAGDYVRCVQWLKRVRHIAQRCGGSLAQCDWIHLTLTEAALRARQSQLARSLVAERTARKPGSRLNRLLQRRLFARPPITPRSATLKPR